jgi:hypothetical protein
VDTNASIASMTGPRLVASPLKPLLGIAALTVLGLAGLAVGLTAGLSGSDLSLLALAILTAAIGFLPFALDSGRPAPRRHVLLSMVSIVYGVSFSIPVVVYYIPASGPIDPPGMSRVNIMNADLITAQILGLLGLLLIFGGYALPIRRALAGLVPQPKYEWTQRGTLVAAGTLIPLGWALYLAGRMGLIPARAGTGFLGGFSDIALVAPALLAIAFLRHRSRISLILLLVLVPLTSGVNAFTSSKRLMLMPWAMVVLAYIVYTRRVRLRWMAAGVLAVALIYPAAQFYRDVVLVGNTRTLMDVLKDPGSALASVAGYVEGQSFSDYLDEGLTRTAGRIDAVGHPAVIIRDTPSVVPFQNGKTLAQLVYSFVPRLVWPNKPTIGIGMWLNDNYNNATVLIDSNIGPSWIGEFYLNFATPGVVVGMLFIGIVFRVWHELLAGQRRTTVLMVAEVVVLKDILFTVTGALIGVLNAPLLGVLPLIVMHVVLRLMGEVRRIDADAGSVRPAAYAQQQGSPTIPPHADLRAGPVNTSTGTGKHEGRAS